MHDDFDNGLFLGLLMSEESIREGQETHRYRTVRIDIKHKDDVFRKLPEALTVAGLKDPKVSQSGEISIKRAFPFCWFESFVAFMAIIAGLVVSFLNRSWLAFVEKQPLPVLVACFAGALAIGFLKGLTLVRFKDLEIRTGTRFLYLRFDITLGDFFMMRLLDELGFTKKPP